MDKRGRLSTLLFVGVIILPLLGLLIMDYQVKRANDLTGHYVFGGYSAYASETFIAGAIIFGVLAALGVTLVVFRVRNSNLISTMPLAKINDEIKKIDERLDKKEEKR